MSKFNWGSRCAECGKEMPAGKIQRCKLGGECTWHIPVAVHQSVSEIYSALKRIYEKEGWVWVGEVLAKAEGK